MPWPLHLEHELNGLTSFGEVGPYRILRHDHKHRYTVSPYLHKEKVGVRTDCTKVLLSRDQVFGWNLNGDYFDVFKFMYGYADMPEDASPSDAYTSSKPGFLVVQLPRQIPLMAIQVSSFEGSGKIIIGHGSDVYLQNILIAEIEPGPAKTVEISGERPKGLNVVIEVPPDTEIPYFTFICGTHHQVSAFHLRIPEARSQTMALLPAYTRPFWPIDQQAPHYTSNVFPTTQIDIHVSGIDSPLGLRLQPAFTSQDQTPVYLDEAFRSVKEKFPKNEAMACIREWPERFKGQQKLSRELIYELLARYGYGEKDKQVRKVDTETEFITPDGVPQVNRKKSDLDWMDSFYIEGLFSLSDPFDAARECYKVIGPLKEGFEIIKAGVLLPMNREYVYLFIQNLRTRYEICLDFFVIQISSVEEWEQLPEMMRLLASYAEQKRIVIRIDYDMPMNEYPVALYMASIWHVDTVIFNNLLHFIRSNGFTSDFKGLMQWWLQNQNAKVTKIFFTDTFVDVLVLDTKEAVRTQYLCRPIGSDGQQLLYKGKTVDFPVPSTVYMAQSRKKEILNGKSKRKAGR